MTPAGIDVERVQRWLTEHVADFTPPGEFTLIAGGHSNLTYACADATGRRWVLRRPPLGRVLASAHDVAREHRLMAALADSAVPVPAVLGLCEDISVNDAPFMLMAYVDGCVLHDATAADALATSERQAIGLHAATVLAALHAIDPSTVGLGDLGRHDGYVARQLKRWTAQWEATRDTPLAAMDDVARLLATRLPAQQGTAIVHGDYRLGNMLVAQGRIAAVLDWELCTLGDALADLGYIMNHWPAPGEATPSPTERLPTHAGGFPSRAAFIARYAQHSTRDLNHIDYYRALAHWRTAAIRQGVYKRYAEGAMAGRPRLDLEDLRTSVARYADAALALLS